MASDDDLRTHWRAQLRAMDEADTESLAELFTPDAVLVHMTGYRQPVAEWFAGIRARQFVYHEVIDKGIQELHIDGETARLRGRVITGITRDGSGQAWPLQISQDYVLTDGAWRCTRSRVRMA